MQCGRLALVDVWESWDCKCPASQLWHGITDIGSAGRQGLSGLTRKISDIRLVPMPEMGTEEEQSRRKISGGFLFGAREPVRNLAFRCKRKELGCRHERTALE